jgi:5-methyltetrahydropteroyltriglutamate--homocysteine methyltransferase
VWAIGVDLVPGAKTLNLVKEFGLSGETLFAGLVDGRNIWADDLAVSVTVIEEFRQALGKGKVFIAPFL